MRTARATLTQSVQPDRHEGIRVCASALPGLQPVLADTCRSFARHTHDLYGIGVIDRGGHRSASGRGVVEAVRGDIITVNPGEVHDGTALQGEARSWRMLYLEPALLQVSGPGASEGARARWTEFTEPVLRSPALRHCFDRLFADAVRGADALALEQGLLQLFLQAPTTAPAMAARERTRCAPAAALERVRSRLADDCASAPSLAELAQEAGLSRYQLLRGFAAAYGLPPHAWLQQCRLARARWLIARGQGLADAAAAVGFSDQSHMTRAFVRFWGYTPGRYAAALRG